MTVEHKIPRWSSWTDAYGREPFVEPTRMRQALQSDSKILDKNDDDATYQLLPFELDPQIIHHIIYSQAGSIGKAIIELLMNSVDANATRVQLTMDRSGFACLDDGQGFASSRDVRRYFGRFGTPHAEGDVSYGRFRLGRGQIMAHAATVWTSNRWRMIVDTQKTGYSYGLESLKNASPGCGITGTWYEALSDAELMSAMQEIRDLVKYTPIIIELNGKVITRDPRKEKWDLEDEFAYYRIKEEGAMSIYNLGVLVRHDPGHNWGVGGLVVTKQAIALNVSRTEILRKTCPNWRAVAKKLSELAAAFTRKLGDHRKTEARRERTVRALLAGEEGAAQLFMKEEVITLLPGKKHVSLRDFLQKCRSGAGSRAGQKWNGARPTFAVVQRSVDVPKGERIARAEQTIIIHPKTLDRFGCDNQVELLDCLEQMIANVVADAAKNGLTWIVENRHGRLNLPTLVDFDTLRDAFKDRTWVVSEKDTLNKEELRIWRALRTVLGHYTGICMSDTRRDAGRAYQGKGFEILIGESNVADAWTDGETYIAINESIVKELNKTPLKTASFIFSLVDHELCHEGDSLACGHDEAFFQRFHDHCLRYAKERQRYFHMWLMRYTTSLEMEGKRSDKREGWRTRYLIDRSGNGREKRGLTRTIEVVSAESAVTAVVAEESMALISAINAKLVEAGCCPAPEGWDILLKRAWTAQQELTEAWRQEQVAQGLEQKAFDKDQRHLLANILEISPNDIEDRALRYMADTFNLSDVALTGNVEPVYVAWSRKAWEEEDYLSQVAYDVQFGSEGDESDRPTEDEWADWAEQDEATGLSERVVWHNCFTPELVAVIEPEETQWSLERNAAAAGFFRIEDYLHWRISERSIETN